jgi:hypothetical protein
MRRPVVLADVRLHLDDPGNPRRAAPRSALDGAVVPDEPAAEQGATDRQRRELEDLAEAARYDPFTRT